MKLQRTCLPIKEIQIPYHGLFSKLYTPSCPNGSWENWNAIEKQGFQWNSMSILDGMCGSVPLVNDGII